MITVREALARAETELRRTRAAQRRAFETGLLMDALDVDPDDVQRALDAADRHDEAVITRTLAEVGVWLRASLAAGRVS